MEFDIVVIGAGPGGYVAAIRAAQYGKKVALIEKENLGGVCLNWGCIPTKALLQAAYIYDLSKKSEIFGVKNQSTSLDLQKMVQYSRDVANKLSGGIVGLMKKNAVSVFYGNGFILDAKNVEITGIDGKKSVLKTSNIIIATGATPREIPGVSVDGKNIWNYKGAMTPDSLPKELLIIGSGAIGMEFANFYNAIGSNVTVVEVADRILTSEDKEISAIAQKAFVASGIKILTGTNVKEAISNNDGVAVKYQNQTEHIAKYDKVISAVGIVPNTQNIGLENVGIKLEKGRILVNDFMQTNKCNIYAIGDVVDGPWLAHKASHEGILCATHIAGKAAHAIKKNSIPSCIYTYPEIASIGLSEEDANLQTDGNIKIGKFPFYANGKAIAISKTDGLVKLIFDSRNGELLGAHLVGHGATEMIASLAIAKEAEATEEEIINTILPHPTMSEAIHEAALSAFGGALHI